MKTLLMMLVAGVLTAQTVYEVTPGTKGNELFLSVVNESKTTDIEKVTVALTNNPTGIETSNKLAEIDKLKKGEEKEVLFTFEAKRIPDTQKDTLKFIITDSKGRSWKKEIILGYTLPKEFKLEQNYPNPFNPSTTIGYSIPTVGQNSISTYKVELKIYDILGREVATLVDESKPAGYYKVNFNAGRLQAECISTV